MLTLFVALISGHKMRTWSYTPKMKHSLNEYCAIGVEHPIPINFCPILLLVYFRINESTYIETWDMYLNHTLENFAEVDTFVLVPGGPLHAVTSLSVILCTVCLRPHKKNKVVSRPEVFQNMMRDRRFFFFFFFFTKMLSDAIQILAPF